MNIPIIKYTSGEVSPKIDARTDIEAHESGCRHLDNFISRIYGVIERRPGTKKIYQSERPPVDDG